MTDPKPEALKDRDKKYGEFEIVDEDQRLTHLWVIDVESKKTKRLTKGSFTVGSFDWSPDGKAHRLRPHDQPRIPSNSGTGRHLDRHASPTRRSGRSSRRPAPTAGPLWSPDGTQIAFSSAMAQPFYYYTNSRIAVDSRGGGADHRSDEGFDENPSPIAWAEGRHLLQRVAEDVRRISSGWIPATQAVTKITPGTQWIVLRLHAHGRRQRRRIRRAPARSEFPERLDACPPTTGTLKKLTDMGAQVADLAAAARRKSSPGRARTARPSRACCTSRRTSSPASAIRCSS